MQAPLLSIPMRYFLEVARCGSVNQAAARLFVAASAVSRQVAKLEDSLGTPLFERQARGMRLTPAGERLAAHLSNALIDADQVMAQVRDLGGQRAVRVRLACTDGFASHFMPTVMREFQQSHPHARLALHVGAPEEVSALLSRGEADVGLKYVVAPEGGLRVEHVAPAPVLAVMRPDHPLAHRHTLDLTEVVRYPLAMGQRGVTARQLFDLACSAAGLRYEAEFVSNMSSVLLDLLRTPGLVLTGPLTVRHLVARGDVVACPINDEMLARRRLQVLSLEGRTLPATAVNFVDHLRLAVQQEPPGPQIRGLS